MFNDNDFKFFEKHRITVAPQNPKQKLSDLAEFAKNPFAYLEIRQRFLNVEFIKFPDEQRRLTHQNNHYLCFGKSNYNKCYFVIGELDNIVYQFYCDDDCKFFVRPINETIANFTASDHYFLATIYELIAERIFIHSDNDDDYRQKISLLCEEKAEKFKQKIQSIDYYAFLNNEQGINSYWQVLYEMLKEADLAFYLRSVSLTDYIETGRFSGF